MLPSLPTSITRMIIYVGSNDAVHHESKLIKNIFFWLPRAFWSNLAPTGLLESAFISGPVPTVGYGDEHFSRLLQPQCTSKEHGVRFFENCQVFWHNEILFKPDGINPNLSSACCLCIICCSAYPTPFLKGLIEYNTRTSWFWHLPIPCPYQ